MSRERAASGGFDMRSVATTDGHDVGLADWGSSCGPSTGRPIAPETFMDHLEAFLDREMRGSIA